MWLQVGRADVNIPRVSGHRSRITDIKWNPFDDNVIASSSEDATVTVSLLYHTDNNYNNNNNSSCCYYYYYYDDDDDDDDDCHMYCTHLCSGTFQHNSDVCMTLRCINFQFRSVLLQSGNQIPITVFLLSSLCC